VRVEATFAVAAVFALFGESAGDSLGGPFVFFLAVASCFVVDTFPHLEEETVIIV